MIDSPFVYLAQTNPVACDLEGNAKQILDAAKTAHELGASICVTPAMSLTGWPLEGWLEREDFWMSLEEAINGLAQALHRQSRDGKIVLVGAPSRSEGKSIARSTFWEAARFSNVSINRCREAVFLRTLAPYLITPEWR